MNPKFLSLLISLLFLMGCSRRHQAEARIELVQTTGSTQPLPGATSGLIPDPVPLLQAKLGPLDPGVELLALRNSNMVVVKVTDSNGLVAATKANDVAAKLAGKFSADPTGIRVIIIDPATAPSP
jgi:hypothetical protein